MSDISTEIKRISDAKDAIKAAIEAKGVTVGGGTIDTYASKIGEIPSTEKTVTVTVITNNPGHQYKDLIFAPNWSTDTNGNENDGYLFDIKPIFTQDKDMDYNYWVQVRRDYTNGLSVIQQKVPVMSEVGGRFVSINSWVGADALIKDKTCKLTIYAQLTDGYTAGDNSLGEKIVSKILRWAPDSAISFFQNTAFGPFDGTYNYTLYFEFLPEDNLTTKACINFILSPINDASYIGSTKESNTLLLDFKNDDGFESVIHAYSENGSVRIVGGSVRRYHDEYLVIDVVMWYEDGGGGINQMENTTFKVSLQDMSERFPLSVANSTITNGTSLTASVDTTNKEITISFLPQSDSFVAGAIILKS